MINRTVVLLAIVSLSIFSCKPSKPYRKLEVKLYHQVDGEMLKFDTIRYTCDAGYAYEITRLNYYLSGFAFTMSNGSTYKTEDVFYIDGRNAANHTFAFSNFPEGTITQLDFYVGLDSVKNQTDSLDASIDNINMGWPDVMGGGYHFMKLEGHYKDSITQYGFAMHLGKNKNLVRIHLNNPAVSDDDNTLKLYLTMNINEWLRNPQIYDFKTDGSYSMNNDTAMLKLCINGADIFN